MVSLATLALLCACALGRSTAGPGPPTTPRESEPPDPPERPPLQCFEVSHPVSGPSGPVSSTMGSVDGACTVRLMVHTFAWSYGKPFVAEYTPPGECGDFNRVIVNFTATSVGRQFDRLAMMFLGDTEVWRTSTAEPSPGTPIAWTRWADLTPYLALWKEPQHLLFDLGNLVDDTYTGVFETSLTATFFRVDEDEEQQRPADVVLPITGRRSAEGRPSHWVYPGTERAAATVRNFPQNSRRAVVSISANGQMSEEFWWANQLESDKDAFPPERQPGLSPFREVRVLIDGEVAGAQWPFPVVFTGGYAPNMHRPVVGIGAFTLRESEVDVSGWLPVLCDGKEHSIELAVYGVEDDGEGGAKLMPVTGQYWVLSAKVFVWLDGEGEDEDKDVMARGGKPTVTVPDPEITYHSTLERDAAGRPEVLRYDISVTRQISISRRVAGGVEVMWRQRVRFTGAGDTRPYAGYQAATATLEGEDEALGPTQQHHYSARYSYPASLVYNATFDKQSGERTVSVELNQTRSVTVHGAAAHVADSDAFVSPSGKRYGAYASTTWRNASAVIVQSPDHNPVVVRRGAVTEQLFRLSGWTDPGGAGRADELYSRAVRAVNDGVESDSETVRGAGGHLFGPQTPPGRAGVGKHGRFVMVDGLVDDFAPARGTGGGGEGSKELRFYLSGQDRGQVGLGGSDL